MGCGSASGAPAPAPTSTVVQAISTPTSIDPASAHSTAVAVESLASTAVARLDARAAAEVTSTDLPARHHVVRRAAVRLPATVTSVHRVASGAPPVNVQTAPVKAVHRTAHRNKARPTSVARPASRRKTVGVYVVVGHGAGSSTATRAHPDVTATSVAVLRLRIQQVASLRAILGRLRVQAAALEGTASSLNPSNQDFNPQVVAALTASLTHVQSQLQTLGPLLAARSAHPPFTRPVLRLSAAERRLQDAVTFLHLAVDDLQAGNGGATAELARSADALRRVRNALNRSEVLLAAVCAGAC